MPRMKNAELIARLREAAQTAATSPYPAQYMLGAMCALLVLATDIEPKLLDEIIRPTISAD